MIPAYEELRYIAESNGYISPLANIAMLDEIKEKDARLDKEIEAGLHMSAKLAQLSTELEQEREHTKALENKLGEDCCACSYDHKDDVCAVHAPRVRELEAELEQVRKDAEYFQFYMSDKPKSYDFMQKYLEGVREHWTLDQWRALCDAALTTSQEKT